MPPTIEGTATFEKVEISPKPEENRVEVFGHYGESVTGYSSKHVEIDGMRILPEGVGHIILEKTESAEDRWIWVIAEKTKLCIEREEPEDEE